MPVSLSSSVSVVSLILTPLELLSRLGRPPLLRRREITLPMPSGAMTQVAFASQPYHHPGSCRDASAWGALFIQNIKTSHLILDVHDCINTAPQLSTLEPLINRLEEKVSPLEATPHALFSHPNPCRSRLSSPPSKTPLDSQACPNWTSPVFLEARYSQTSSSKATSMSQNGPFDSAPLACAYLAKPRGNNLASRIFPTTCLNH